MNDEPLTDGQTDIQNFTGYNIIPRHFFVAGHKNERSASHIFQQKILAYLRS